MYTITRGRVGLEVVLTGTITSDEWQAFAKDYFAAKAREPRPWLFLFDVTNMHFLDQSTFGTVVSSLAGGDAPNRVAILVPNAMGLLQAKRLARTAGLHDVWEIIDAAADPNPRERARQWLASGALAGA
jgi:hypothetical protein